MLPARRHGLSRLEAVSDAVFAFALTLLVVSLEVPSTYDDLMALMAGFVPFAASFALLVSVGVGALAIGMAWLAPAALTPLSGFAYFLMGAARWIYGVRSGRRRQALAASLAEPRALAPTA